VSYSSHSVAEVVYLRSSEIDSATKSEPEESAKFIQGVSNQKRTTTHLVDLNKLLSDDKDEIWVNM